MVYCIMVVTFSGFCMLLAAIFQLMNSVVKYRIVHVGKDAMCVALLLCWYNVMAQ